jgi:methionine sulfoxide reductase catalytic subunit
MSNILIRPEWALPERLITPEAVYRNRRQFLKQMGLASAGLVAGPLVGCSHSQDPAAASAPAAGTNTLPGVTTSRHPKKYPAPRDPEFQPTAPITAEKVVATYNNFYEFSTDKEEVSRRVGRFVTAPWPIAIGGLVDKPLTIDAEELVGEMPLEERAYRLRCVEAWAAVIPWTGFPLSKLIAKAKPRSDARFLRFETFNRPDQAPGMRELPNYPWPYFEGLRMDEAMNPLTLVVTGMYGRPLLKQDGAPIRIIVPWKYGYKSIKSVVKIQFIAQQPKTFWETLWPEAYPFESNVNPNVPHPRWSQATERVLGTGERVKTQLYNGYGKYVAKLYGRA